MATTARTTYEIIEELNHGEACANALNRLAGFDEDTESPDYWSDEAMDARAAEFNAYLARS